MWKLIIQQKLSGDYKTFTEGNTSLSTMESEEFVSDFKGKLCCCIQLETGEVSYFKNTSNYNE